MAILLVLAAQFWANVPHVQDGVLAAGWNKLAGYGVIGGTLFFVLSGFWIARSLIQHRGRPGFFGRFFLRRAGRILPLYGLLLVTAFVATKVLFPFNADLWEPAVSEHMPRWAHAAFMQNVFMALTGSMGCEWLNPTWALAVEVQFYLLMPVVVWLVAPRWLPALAGLGLVACWAFRWSLQAHGAHVFLSSLTLPGRADALLIGVLAACAWEQAGAREWLRQHRRLVRWVALGAGTTWVLSFEGVGSGAMGGPSFVVGGTVLAVGLAGVIVEVLAREDGRLARMLAARPLVFWGGISFFVYLAHQPVNSLVHAGVFQDWPQTASLAGIAVTMGSVAIVALGGWVSQRWFEGPIVAWSRRVQFGRRRIIGIAPAAMPAGYAPPWVRWTRGLVGTVRRPKLRAARAVVRVR